MTKNILIDHVLDTPRPSVNEVWISKDRRDLNGGSPRTITILEVVEGKFVTALSSTTNRKTTISIDTLVGRYKKSEPPKEAHVDPYTMVRRHSDMEPLRYAHDCTCGGRFIFQSKCPTKKRSNQ